MIAYLVRDDTILATGDNRDIKDWKRIYKHVPGVSILVETWVSESGPEVIPEPEGELIKEDEWN